MVMGTNLWLQEQKHMVVGTKNLWLYEQNYLLGEKIYGWGKKS
jgi:hypothetical protein